MRASTLRSVLLVTGTLLLVAMVFQVFWLGKLYQSVRDLNKELAPHTLDHLQYSLLNAGLILLALIILAACLFWLLKKRSMDTLQKDFVNNITHEFKTPLAVMKIASDVLANDQIIGQPEKLKKYSSIVQEQTNNLQSHVEKLLRITVTERNLSIPESREIEVSKILEKALSLLEPLIQRKNAQVLVTVDPGASHVHGDERQLQMLVIDLVENALKYAPHPQVVLSTFRRKNMLAISCRDNGPGIGHQYQAQVFRKFYRIPTGNVHNVKGFGLGLYFARKIALLHHGKIEVRSEEGKGSEFIVYLPG